MPCVAPQDGDAPIKLPDLQVMPVQHPCDRLLCLLVRGAIKLVNGNNVTFIVEGISAVVHSGRSPHWNDCNLGQVSEEQLRVKGKNQKSRCHSGGRRKGGEFLI